MLLVPRYRKANTKHRRLLRTDRNKKAGTDSSSRKKNDWICMVILCIGLLFYFYFMYLLFRGDIRLLRVNTPSVMLQPIPFSFNFTEHQLDSDFVSWMKSPDSLCWNLHNRGSSTVFIVTVMVHYDDITKLYIRQNRMYYAMINDYVYCEYSESNSLSPNIGLVDNGNLGDIALMDNRYERWYKLLFIKYLMNDEMYRDIIEYIFWIDFDGIIINFHYSVQDNVLELYGDEYSLYAQRDPFAVLNSGVFILRNNEWTLNLLDYCTSDSIIQSAFQKSPFRDQWAFLQYNQRYPEEWTKHVVLIEGLQLLHTGNDLKDYIPSIMMWHIDGSKTKQTTLIECVLWKYQPQWFLQIAYNHTNRDSLTQKCVDKLHGYR